MGGLDARMMIYQYKMDDRVASLTTLGTPHHGTYYADWGVKRLGFFIHMARPFGLNLSGFMNLTRENCRRFNRLTQNFEEKNGVLYQTIAGVQSLDKIFFQICDIW